jgi:DNA-binding CsgD family transcriptional regulator
MARLTARDYGAALEFLKFAGDVGGTDPFPEPVLERLRLLVGCDCVSYGEYAGRAVRRRNIRAAPAGFLPVRPEVARAHDRLRHRSPLLPRPATLDRPVRLSDCLTRREIPSHPLYEPVWRRLGSERPMSLWLTDRGRILGGFGFDSATRDFTARDKLVLETLVPHLVQLHRAARARAAATGETEATQALTAREREVLRLVADGLSTREIAAALWIAPGTVRKHLDNVFAKLGVGSRAAAVSVAIGVR